MNEEYEVVVIKNKNTYNFNGKVGRHILERLGENFVSPEELMELERKAEFLIEESYWNIINEVTNT